MFGLIYKTFTYFFAGTALNKGERDQPAPLVDQEAYLMREIIRVRREREALAARLNTQHTPVDVGQDAADAQEQ